MRHQVGHVEPEVVPEDTSSGTGGWTCIIFNNEHNSTDEVVAILITATGCGFEEAYCEMWEAHTYGKTACHFGPEEECRRVAGIISSIGVGTEVRKEWD